MTEKQIVELVDDEGNSVSFFLEDSFTYNDKNYVILSNDEEEAVLFRVDDVEDLTEFIRPSDKEFEEVKEAYYESE